LRGALARGGEGERGRRGEGERGRKGEGERGRKGERERGRRGERESLDKVYIALLLYRKTDEPGFILKVELK